MLEYLPDEVSTKDSIRYAPGLLDATLGLNESDEAADQVAELKSLLIDIAKLLNPRQNF